MYVVFDLDGTLCNDSHRRPLIEREQESKDYDAYHEALVDDTPVKPLVALLKYLVVGGGTTVEIWTGRPEKYRQPTKAWLQTHLGFFCANRIRRLRMRPTGDMRDINTVKAEWLEIGNYPDLIFDDRAKTVNFCRSLGITTCQVADNT